MQKATSWLIGAQFLILNFFIQLYLLIRYQTQNPDDIIGLLLFSIAAISFLIAAGGFTLQYKKLKK